MLENIKGITRNYM